MLTQWRDEMITGNHEIDGQHQELLRRVDDLLKGARAKKGSEEIGKLMWFLKKYVRRHFKDEEKLQLESGYPGYEAHKAQHEMFFREVLRLEALHAEQGENTLMIVAAVNAMCEWLRSHFKRMDMELIEFLRDNNITRPALDPDDRSDGPEDD